MNKVYKVIWSKVRNCYIVVSELAKRNRKNTTSDKRRKLTPSMALAAMAVILNLGIAEDASAWCIKANNGVGYICGENTSTSADGLNNSQAAWGIGKLAEITYYSTATGVGATAWAGGRATGSYSTAWGAGALASGARSTAWNRGQSTGSDATSWGRATASGSNATAWGSSATVASGSNATAFGQATVAHGANATAWGYETQATLNNATAFGKGTRATQQRATAFGYNTTASGWNSTAWGESSEASGTNSTAFGYATTASIYAATAFGYNTTASGYAATAFGYNTTASGDAATAWGKTSEAAGTSSTAFGQGSTANAENSLAALGGTTASAATNSFAIGKGARVESEDSHASGNTAPLGSGSSGSVAIGNSSTIGTKAFGSLAAVGGTVSDGATHAIAIGNGSSAKVSDSVAIGSSSVAARDAGIAADGSTRNGYDAYYAGGHINTSGESFNSNYIWRSTLAGVSVGDVANGLTRRIEGVAAGWEDTDAVNVAQLKAATIEVKAGNGISVTPSVREGGGIVYTIDAIGGAASSATISSDKRAVDVVNTEGQQIVTSPFLNIQGVPEAAETDRAIASGASAIAMGHGAQATETNATAIGTKAHALGESGVAIGTAVSTSGERAIAIGSSDADTESHMGTRAAGQGAIVLGDRASAVSDEYDFTKGAVKAGHDTDTNVNDAIAIGTRTQSRAQNAIALGGNLSYTYETTGADNVTTTKTVYGELKGRSAGATVGDAADSGIAIGGAYGSIDKTNKTVTIEIDAAATYGKRGIAIGTGALVADKADFASLEELMSRTDYVNLKNNYNTKYADYMRRLNDYNAIQNSTNPLVTDEMKNDARISLNKAEAALETATTNFADVIKTKLQLQAEDSAKEEDAIAIGTRSNATVRTSVALGAYSATTALDKAGNRTGTVGYDVSTGKQYAGADKFSPTWQSTAGSLSIGGGVNPTTGETVTRRISNVSAGVYDTDAVNVAQLRRAAVYKTDFKNTAIGKDENGYLEITSPFINVQGVKEASEANTLLNTYQNAADYKKSVDADIQTMRDGKANLERDIRTLTKDIQTLETTMASAGSQTSAAYISAKTEKQIKEDELAVLKGELKELNGSLQEKIEESATANERYAEAQKTVKSQAKAEGENAMALGYGTTASGDESIAMGKGNKATGKQSLAIGTGNDVTGNHSGAIGDPNIVNADNSYMVGNNSNIAAGQTDVFAFGNDITKTTSNSVFLGSKSAYVPEGKTTAGMSDYSSANIDGRTLRFAGGKPAGVVSVGNENEPRRIQNVAAGKISADSTDAINGSQLYGAMTEMNNNVNSQIGGVEHRMKKGLAGAAALAALHPLDFDPDDKLTFAAGMGHYRGENAAALGMFYRPDEKVMFSVGG
ncbi:MAG: YadA-like family protein, partial [Acidaminococcaceae bacterium]|nr:YadA-like family protein [Acidaminococcaceae bacterium]